MLEGRIVPTDNFLLNPTIFEVAAQELLANGLRPAFVSLMEAVARYNSSVEFCSIYSTEIYYTGLAFLENHYLSFYDASFSENFYGLIRKRLGGRKINNWDRYKALFTLTIMPYLRYRLQKLCEQSLEVEPPQLDENASWKDKFRYWLTIYGPSLETFFNAVYFASLLMFMFDKKNPHGITLRLLGQTLQRLSASDLHDIRRRLSRSKVPGEKSGLFRKLFTYFRTMGYTVAQSFRFILLAFLYGYRLIDFFTSERDRLLHRSRLPIPPAPPLFNAVTDGCSIPSDNLKCPICRQERKNPAALTPGFVYCYVCITKHVNEHKRCPITHIPVKKDEIRRIFEN